MLNAKKKGVTSLLSRSLPPQLPVSQGDLSPSRHWVDQHDHDHYENLYVDQHDHDHFENLFFG